MVPVQLYDKWAPPVLPQVAALPEVMQLIPLVTSAVINEAGTKSSANAARTFCYNLLVYQFWQNEHFNEVVKLALDMLAFNVRKGFYRSPEMGVDDVAKQALSLYTSNLVYLYPDLKAYSSPQFLDAALQNVPVLNSLKQEIAGMYNNAPRNLPPANGNLGYPMNMGNDPRLYPAAGGYAHPSAPGFPNAPQANYPPYDPRFQTDPRMYQPAFNPAPYMPPRDPRFQYGSCYQDPYQSSAVGGANVWNNPPPPSALVESAASTQEDRFATRLISKEDTYTRPPVMEAPGRTDWRNVPVEEVEEAPVIDTAREVPRVKTKEDSIVERSRHEIKAYGEAYRADDVVKVLTRTEDEAPREPVTQLPDLHQSVLVGINEDDIALDAEFAYLGSRESTKRSDKAFRCFGISVTPLVSKVDLTSMFNSIRATQPATFSQLAVTIAELIRQNSSIQADNSTAAEYMTALLKLDAFLTKTLNEFYRDVISNKVSVSMSSFTTDYADFAHFVDSQLPSVAGDTLRQFEATFVRGILETQSGDLMDDIAEAIGAPESLFFEVLPVAHSFTFLSDTLFELFETGSWKESVAIARSDAPGLHALCDSLREQRESIRIRGSKDYFITRDGIWFSVVANPYNEGEYLARLR